MEKSCTLTIRCKPNAAQNSVVGITERGIEIKIAAQPEDGKANKELIDFLSDVLEIRKSAIVIVRGHSSRTKNISISGMGKEDILKLLNNQKRI
jgi:uncharacterized protein